MTTSWERLLTSTRPAVSDDHSHRLRLRPGAALVLWAVFYNIKCTCRCQLPSVFATSVTRGGGPAVADRGLQPGTRRLGSERVHVRALAASYPRRWNESTAVLSIRRLPDKSDVPVRAVVNLSARLLRRKMSPSGNCIAFGHMGHPDQNRAFVSPTR